MIEAMEETMKYLPDGHDRGQDGSLMIDGDFLILVNAWWEPLAFTIPATRGRRPGSARAGWLR
jgi:hypothetical protein